MLHLVVREDENVKLFSDIIRGLTMTLSAILLALLATVVSLDVTLRYLIGIGFLATHDLMSIFLTMFFFVILPVASLADGHVRMDIFYRNFPGRLRGAADILGFVGGAIFFGAIGWEALRRSQFMRDVNITSPTVSIPLWPVSVFVGVCCLIALFAMAHRFIDTLRGRSMY
jgi:TRAP-type C4-dicarboxylate transport system permease small subunit